MPQAPEDTLAFISDLHQAHVCCDILLDIMKNADVDKEKARIHEKTLWDGATMALRRAFNSGRPMGKSVGKQEYTIKKNVVPSILEKNGWAPTCGRDFSSFYAIGDKVVAHGNRVKGVYEVLNEGGKLILVITLPEQEEIIEFREMCITLECYARSISGLDPEFDTGK